MLLSCRPAGRTVMGRPRKSYFARDAEYDEHRGLLSSGSQDAVVAEASSTPPSPSGHYQGLGHTRTPHSRSAPAELCSTPWVGDVDDVDDITPTVLSVDPENQARTHYDKIT